MRPATAFVSLPQARSFAAKNDDDPKGPSKTDLDKFEEQKAKKTGKSVKAASTEASPKTRKRAAKLEEAIEAAVEEEVKPKRKRRSKAEIEAEKLQAKLNEASAKVKSYKGVKVAVEKGVEPMEMYTLKFNSPILPFSKFPLT